jgi:hypothetical protein
MQEELRVLYPENQNDFEKFNITLNSESLKRKQIIIISKFNAQSAIVCMFTNIVRIMN